MSASCWNWDWCCRSAVDTGNRWVSGSRPTVSRLGRKIKTPSVFGWREVMDLLEPDFRRDRRSRDRKMSHQNAIREGPRIRPALNAAHGGGFRCARKRPDVIDSKWSGREDLNLRPPGPEFAALPCLPFVFNDLS